MGAFSPRWIALSLTLFAASCAGEAIEQEQEQEQAPKGEEASQEPEASEDPSPESKSSGEDQPDLDTPKQEPKESQDSQGSGSQDKEEPEPEASDSSEQDCELPDPAQSWILAYQREIVAKLSGETALKDGTKLGVRSSKAQRSAAMEFLKSFWGESFDVQEHRYRDGGVNLVVTIEATHPLEPGQEAPVMVFGAHYDSVPKSPGANDNATGVAAVMSAARFAAMMPCRNRTWHFVLFDEEEIGLVGSAAYAKKLVADKTKVQEVHTIDQMGWDADKDRAIELERPGTGLLECYEKAQTSTNQSFDLHKTKTGSTDHVSFRKAGFSAVGITEEYVSGDTTPHYHRPGDTFDTVDFDYLESTTILIHQMLRDRSGV